MTIEFLDASKRESEAYGPKMIVSGEPGVGKTSLLNTVPPELLATTLLVDLEAGDLPVRHLPIASIRPRTWLDLRDVAVAIGGPDPARSGSSPYSKAHYDTVIANPDLANLRRFSMLFIDSYTEASRRCRVWCETQAESFNAYGKRDTRGMYGLIGREMISWTQQLQQIRSHTIVLVAVLEKVTDDYGVSSWRIQLEGQSAARALPAILDEILVMAWTPSKTGKPFRAFVCQPNNPWGFPVKDRSGKLGPIEEPHLGKLLAKLATRQEKESENG